jgi:MFS family permease
MFMALYVFSFIDRQLISLVVQPVMDDLKINKTEFSLIGSFGFTLIYVLAGLPMGWMVDRWTRIKIVFIGATFWSIMAMATGFAHSAWMFFIARLGIGIGEASLSPSSYSLLSDMFSKNKLGRVVSLYGLGIPVGSGLALLGGGWVLDRLLPYGTQTIPFIGTFKPWQMLFVVIAFPGLVLAFLTLLIREPTRHEDENTEGTPNFGQVFRYMRENSTIYLSAMLGSGCYAAFSTGLAIWGPFSIKQTYGLSDAQVGIYFGSLIVVFGIIGTVSAGWMSDRLISRGRLDGPFLCGLIYAAGLFISGVGGSFFGGGKFGMFLFFCSSLFIHTWTAGIPPAILQMVTPSRMRGQVSAIYILIAGGMGNSIGPLAVAFSSDYIFGKDVPVATSLVFVGSFFLISAAILFQIGRRPLKRFLSLDKFALVDHEQS